MGDWVPMLNLFPEPYNSFFHYGFYIGLGIGFGIGLIVGRWER